MTIIINLEETITHKIDRDLLKRAIELTLESLNRPEVDITLQLTNDEEMRQLNQTYRGLKRTTDVLAFNQDYIDPETGQFYLGDIIISIEQAHAQALENDLTLNEECARLAIHGALHLLGFDHAEAKEKEEMWHKQETILKNVMKSIQEDAK